MSMTRQHYEKLARALGEAVAAEAIEGDSTPATVHSVEAAYRVALAVADCLPDSSPRYNRARFIEAVREHAERTRCELGGLPAIEAGHALRAAGVA